MNFSVNRVEGKTWGVWGGEVGYRPPPTHKTTLPSSSPPDVKPCCSLAPPPLDPPSLDPPLPPHTHRISLPSLTLSRPPHLIPPPSPPLPPSQAYASLVPDLDLTTAIVVRALEGEEVEGGWV